MANHKDAKLKTLYVRQILEEETDAEHGLTMRQIIDRLAQYGIPAERKAIYRDIDLWREVGLDIKTYQRNPVEYAIDKRGFTLPELMLLVDAVESCRFLTRRQSNALITNLKLLASDPQRQLLDRRIHVAGRVTSKVDSVFSTIDLLHEAMRANRQVHFTYFRIGPDGQRQPTRDGRPHEVTPVAVSFEDGFYYLSAWDSDHNSLAEYRLDRMGAVRLTDNPAVRNPQTDRHSFEEDEYVAFGHFRGDPVTVTLAVEPGKAEIVLDRFGDKVQLFPQQDGSAKAVVKVRKSQQFFGWVAGLGNAVRIEAPTSLKAEYRAYLQSLLEQS